jgi:ribosomal protein S19E (S16A)
MAAPSRTVKDVDPHKFVKEYSAYLRSTGKVRYSRLAVWVHSRGLLRDAAASSTIATWESLLRVW